MESVTSFKNYLTESQVSRRHELKCPNTSPTLQCSYYLSPPFLPLSVHSHPQYTVFESLKQVQTVGIGVMDVGSTMHGRSFPDQANLKEDPKHLPTIRAFGKEVEGTLNRFCHHSLVWRVQEKSRPLIWMMGINNV